MDSNVVTDVTRLDAAWLTSVLHAAGALEHGQVSRIEQVHSESTNARCARLILQYSDDARGSPPPSLFLKICSAESAEFGTTEIEWYTKIAVPVRECPIPRCYHVAYAPDTGQYHLLLEDLSDTHHNLWGMQPAAELACKTAVSLARIHAAWWDHPHVLEDARYPTATVINRYCAEFDGGLTPMLEYLGDRLSPDSQAVLRRVFADHRTSMVRRAAEGKHLTYIHSDPNPGNILAPHSLAGRVYLVDRQVIDDWLSIWIGASDLAYMMVLWWEPEARRHLERTVLDAYYQALLQLGVREYSWDQLWRDYRLAVPQGMYVAADWCIDDDTRSAKEWVWWPKLQRALEAFHDLECADLLG